MNNLSCTEVSSQICLDAISDGSDQFDAIRFAALCLVERELCGQDDAEGLASRGYDRAVRRLASPGSN